MDNNFIRVTPITVEAMFATIHGNKKSAAFAEPCAARMLITVVGRICRLVAEITTIIITLVFALGCSSPSSLMDEIPIGVAAFPRPIRFADNNVGHSCFVQ